VNPETLTFNHAARRPENGWFWIAGAVGIFLASYAIPDLPFTPFPFIEDKVGWRFFPRLFSGVPLLIGIGILGIRQGVRLDRRKNTVESWHGFLPFLRTRTVGFGEIGEVKIGKLVLPSRYGPPHVIHSVKLMGPEPHVLISSEEHYADARAAAEQVAAFLGIPLRDEAIGPVYREDGTAIETRAPEALDASLQQQAAVPGKAPPFPIRPRDCRIRVRREPSRYVFELPPLRRSLAMALGVAALSLAFAVGLGLIVMRNIQPEDPIAARVCLWLLPAAAALIGPSFALGRGINRRAQNETIAITPLALSRDVRQRWTQCTVELPCAAIEEFGYTPMAAAWTRSSDAGRRENLPMVNAAISVRTDFKRMYLGQGLRRSEQIWLHDALKYLLAQTASGRASARNGPKADR